MFPADTPLEIMRAWREDQQFTARAIAPSKGSLAADIDTYLTRIRAMPTYKQRAAHLALWAQALGRDRHRNTITAADIDAIMQEWLLTPTRPGKGQRGRPSAATGLTASTIRKRRTSLQCFYTAMNGKGNHNPVKGTTNPRAALPEPRAIDYDLIEKVIAAMPERLSAKRGVISPISLAKVRVRVMAHTGLPPSLIKTILPTDINWQDGALRVRARHKGQGVEARTITLTANGLAALRLFHATNAYGHFTTEALNRSFKRGCRQVGLDASVRLYDLRHSFLTEVYRVTRDLATVARMGMHAPGSPMTARYTQGVHDEVDRAAARALDASFIERGLSVRPDEHGAITAKTVAGAGATLHRIDKPRIFK